MNFHDFKLRLKTDFQEPYDKYFDSEGPVLYRLNEFRLSYDSKKQLIEKCGEPNDLKGFPHYKELFIGEKCFLIYLCQNPIEIPATRVRDWIGNPLFCLYYSELGITDIDIAPKLGDFNLMTGPEIVGELKQFVYDRYWRGLGT